MPDCPRCHKPIKADADLCTHCDADLCPNCGALVGPDDTACSACGETWILGCPRCDGDVAPDDQVCPHCGFVFDSGPRPTQTRSESEPEHLPDPLPDPGQTPACPHCGTRIYVGDPSCATCGRPLCPRCGTAVEEDVERGDQVEYCPTCELELTFTCPGCEIELLSGAQVCPDCGLIFAHHCSSCGAHLFRAPDRCPNCQQPAIHQKRTTARSRSGRVGEFLIRWTICPACRTNFVPSEGPCPQCGARICPGCHVMLTTEETTCLRCGVELGAARTCPRCSADIPPGAPECAACEQALCPHCSAAVGENDTTCATCGTELVLLCSDCGGEVNPNDDFCPHCGASFDPTQEEPEPPSSAKSAPIHTAPSQTSEPQGKCATCGKAIPRSALLCDDCLYLPNR